MKHRPVQQECGRCHKRHSISGDRRCGTREVRTPGDPFGLGSLAYVLFTRHLRHDPADPEWPDRDRFVLSVGHASSMLYASLHLSGYDLSIEDLKNFRQWGWRTPGHPERGVTLGVEVSTGPLGQGIANAVGMAIAERMPAARYNQPGHTLSDHRTWVVASDGDMMEGISSEVASLAGLLGLGKLTVFYDDNRISIEGSTNLAFCEQVTGRFRVYGWHVQQVSDANDLDAIERAIAAVAIPDRPSLIMIRSHIGYGSPLQDNPRAHGAPVGAENIAATRRNLAWNHGPFETPAEVYDHWHAAVAAGAHQHGGWRATWEHYKAAEPRLASEFERVVMKPGRLPNGWREALPTFEPGSRVATRMASGMVLNALAPAIPELVGGAADVAPAADTYLRGAGDTSAKDWFA